MAFRAWLAPHMIFYQTSHAPAQEHLARIVEYLSNRVTGSGQGCYSQVHMRLPNIDESLSNSARVIPTTGLRMPHTTSTSTPKGVEGFRFTPENTWIHGLLAIVMSIS